MTEEHDCFEQSKVTDSRPLTGGRFRKRECKLCGKAFFTQELPLEEDDLPEWAKLDTEKIQRMFDRLVEYHTSLRTAADGMEEDLEVLWPKSMRATGKG
jgi:transcriptional regulator NrdR family protein